MDEPSREAFTETTPSGPQSLLSRHGSVVDSRQLRDLLELQRAILESIARDRPLGEVLDALCHLVEAMLPRGLASVMVLEEARLTVKAGPSFPPGALGYFNGIALAADMGSCANSVLSGGAVYVEDAATDPRWDGLRESLEDLSIGACWSIPITGEADQVLGTFAITFQDKTHPDHFHGEILRTASHLAGIALRHEAHAQRHSQWATALENLSEGVVITDNRGQIIDVNRAFTEITGFALDEVHGTLPSVLRSGRHDESFYQRIEAELQTTGRWQGEIWHRRKNGEVYPEWLSISRISDGHGATRNYVGVFADISRFKAAESRLARMAHHDALTDLPNRLLLTARLEHAIEQAGRTPRNLAILFIDLDRFKTINDSLGHATGDLMLTAAADRLASRMREQDTIARVGGDEFVVIIDEIRQPRDAGTVARELIEALEGPFYLNKNELYISASVGISLYPEDGADSETLVKHADMAMYRAKAEGGGTYAYYTPSMTQHMGERLSLEADLRQALERNEFELFYQPQVRSADGGLAGAEALLRWRHPQLGLLSPARFVYLLEETRLIRGVGNWVLHQACRQARDWQKAGYRDLHLAVNLSSQQISRECIVANLRQALGHWGLNPANLELEISENFVVEHAERAIAVLDEISRLGVALAIDDFGKGYSSLAHLRRLPVNKLKIDRSLVCDVPTNSDDQAICNAVIALGHSLGLTVVAEGVETRAHHDYLRAAICDEQQGTYFDPPLPAPRFEARWLRGERR